MKSKAIWIGLIVILAVAAIWFFTVSTAPEPADEHPSVVDIPAESAAVESPPPPEHPIGAAQPEEPPEVQEPLPQPEPLPPLDQSDPVIKAELVETLGEEPVENWLVTDEFINRVVATIDSLTSRQVAPVVLPVKPPEGEFRVTGPEENLSIAEENFSRYDPYVSLFAEADPEQLADLYRQYYPLFQSAYEDLGYPDGYLNDRLVDVIDHLLATPEPDAPPRLIKPEAVYLYADEGLESLTAGQKLLIRIGPENRRIVQERLRELRAHVTVADD